jgi:hypothetical protein
MDFETRKREYMSILQSGKMLTQAEFFMVQNLLQHESSESLPHGEYESFKKLLDERKRLPYQAESAELTIRDEPYIPQPPGSYPRLHYIPGSATMYQPPPSFVDPLSAVLPKAGHVLPVSPHLGPPTHLPLPPPSQLMMVSSLHSAELLSNLRLPPPPCNLGRSAVYPRMPPPDIYMPPPGHLEVQPSYASHVGLAPVFAPQAIHPPDAVSAMLTQPWLPPAPQHYRLDGYQ